MPKNKKWENDEEDMCAAHCSAASLAQPQHRHCEEHLLVLGDVRHGEVQLDDGLGGSGARTHLDGKWPSEWRFAVE